MVEHTALTATGSLYGRSDAMATDYKMVAGGLGVSHALRHDKGPSWDGQKLNWYTWWYEMTVYLKMVSLWGTVSGFDRAQKASTAQEERLAYEDRAMVAFRVLFRSILDTRDEGMALKMQIRDEFGEETDGYELAE